MAGEADDAAENRAAGLEHHEWVVEQWKRLKPPMLTCEAVLTEAAFLLKREGVDTDPLFALLERGVIRVALEIEDQAADLRTLMRRMAEMDAGKKFRLPRKPAAAR